MVGCHVVVRCSYGLPGHRKLLVDDDDLPGACILQSPEHGHVQHSAPCAYNHPAAGGDHDDPGSDDHFDDDHDHHAEPLELRPKGGRATGHGVSCCDLHGGRSSVG